MRDVVIVGAGMHRYGLFDEKSVTDFGVEAVVNALADAGMGWDEIETAYCGTGNGGMSAGHKICQQVGLTGLGVTNVENASASGSSAFREAYLSVASGAQDTAIAIGVDKWRIRKKKDPSVPKQASKPLGPVNIFAHMANQHMEEHGTTRDQLAAVAVKSHYNASLNPYAHYQQVVTMEEVHNARMIADPLTVMHCCPWGDGGAAVIIAAKDKAEKITDKFCPTVSTSVLTSILPDGDPMITLTEYTANMAYEKSGTKPKDLDLIELHDAFTIEEIVYTEALGLCEPGQGGRLAEEGVTALDGEHPMNTSGGLISMGHPIGPTGLGQIAEILWQMRGECGKRQVKKKVNLAMAHMVGAGGVCIIHLFKR